VEPREAAARILSAHLKLIVGLVLAGAVAAFLLHLDDQELFTASARVTLDTSDPQTAAEAQAIADTARAIVTSPGIIDEALARVGVIDPSAEDVSRFASESVHVQGLGSSDVVELSVTYPSARTAAAIANQLADSLIKTRLQATRGRLSQILAGIDARLLTIDREIVRLRATENSDAPPTRAQLLQLSRQRSDLASQRENITAQDALRPQPLVIDRAGEPMAPDPSRLLPDIALGALLGLIVGIGLAAMIETITPTLVGPEAVAREVGAPVLAELPRANGTSTDFQRELADNHVRLAAGFARIGAFELADLGRITMSTDIALLASRLSDPSQAARVQVTGGEHPEVRSVRPPRSGTDGDATTSGGLVVVAPTVVKKRNFQRVSSSLQAGNVKLFGVVTYPPTSFWRSVAHRLSGVLSSVAHRLSRESRRGTRGEHDEHRHT
jgi:capsular polysaccharide biosynthesis protein